MALKCKDILVCSTHGHIFALSKRNGSRLWKMPFPGGSLGESITLFATDYNKLIAGARGTIACLDLLTGNIIWSNRIGIGVEEVSISSTPRHTSSSQGDFLNSKYERIVIAAARGKVMAFNGETGLNLWTYQCPGGWFKTPIIITEPEAGTAFVGAGSWVYCLRIFNGDVIWNTRVTNIKTGLDSMMLATTLSSLSSTTSSTFNQNPISRTQAS